MKILIIGLAIVATALASLPSEEYLPPLDDSSLQNNVDLQSLSESSALSDDGYRYKTVKRLRYRHRRDVSELPADQYLPPVAAASDAQPVVDLPVIDTQSAASADSAVLADDGYRYKTVKRYRFRHRRDVSELPAAQYLPPVEESASAAAESAPVEVEAEAAPAASEDSAVLADDGYRYKTVKRYRFRHRRDVSELPAAQYLPPVEESSAAAESAPVEVEAEAAPAASDESAVLADDGYRYKTVKRYRFRHRRDVSELPAAQYLPPVEESEAASAPVEVEAEAAPAASEDSAVLADDGYRYKTVKRYRFRHRRDVSELPAAQYLPPVEESSAAAESAPVEVEAEAAPAASDESAVLADDGYRYKTVKRYRFRHRRDVSELPAAQYLPPVEESEAASAPVEVEAEAAPAASDESAVLADDGYRYKTVKRYRFRHRRDVSELPAAQYLPPVEESSAAAESAPVEVEAEAAPAASEDSAVLADDGYRYKTVKRYRLRHRRDVSELPANEYLPPVAESEAESAPVEVKDAPAPVDVESVPAPSEESGVLADDGYRYKTVKRVVYRHRA